MIIIISFRRTTAFILVITLLSLIGLSYLSRNSFKTTTVFRDESKDRLTMELQLIFDLRNAALLGKDKDSLASIYNQQVRKGIWAFEHELKKMKYIHHWAEKQYIKFIRIDSNVLVTSYKAKGNGYNLNLTVSTEYRYAYKDDIMNINTFRIGTYHSLDLMPNNEGWHIIREWYTDPFADSLNIKRIDSDEVHKLILFEKYKDFSQIDEKRLKAVKYADEYSGAANLLEDGYKYNTEYKNYNNLGGDCANFASQILYASGGFRKNWTWNYTNRSGSKAWVNANAFNSYMVNSGRASMIARGSYESVLKSSYKLLPGDYVAYEKNGKVTHISVVTGVDSRGYTLVNSHNTDRHRVPWDLGWNNGDIKFRLVRVHY